MVNVEVFWCLNVKKNGHVRLKMNKISELVAILICLDKSIGVSDNECIYISFYVWNECTKRLK